VDLEDFLFLLLASERDLVELVDFSFFSCSAYRLAKYIDLVDYNARNASELLIIADQLLVIAVKKNCR